MQTIDIYKINIKVAEVFPLDNSEEIIHSAMPIQPANKGYYIWYKDSIPEVIDTSIMSDEYELLYQSVKLTEYKSKLNMYVSVYTACLTIVILFLLSTPFLPEALASFNADKSSVIIRDVKDQITPTDQLTDAEPNSETVKGITWNSLGFNDLKNNVLYVIMPNGKYSIQESSWNIEEKAVNRINRINSLDIKYSDGMQVKAIIEKVDLPSKGVWYRTRIGEFASIKDAIETAVQLRGEEKLKNLTDLYTFPVSILKV